MIVFFFRTGLLLGMYLGLVINSCHSQDKVTATSAQISQRGERVGGACECCEGIYEELPDQLTWQTILAGDKERGERLKISGTVYKLGGITPAPGIILYVYHTDAAGYYSGADGNPSRVNSSTPCATRHGHLRGWMKTDSQGRYLFQTIRPAAYPGRDEPAHIHAIVKEPHLNEYYVSDYLFSDDSLLTEQKKQQIRPFGGCGILTLARQRDGSWVGKRDIILGLHITNYPR
jgi:protocatechuate 3,4-dioxygenase beta subunit